METMKQLIVSIYDSGWGGYSAKEINSDGSTNDIEITMSQVDEIDSICGYHDEKSEWLKEQLNKYDMIIVCNNGRIDILRKLEMEVGEVD